MNPAIYQKVYHANTNEKRKINKRHTNWKEKWQSCAYSQMTYLHIENPT